MRRRSKFEYYVRTGRLIVEPAPVETKFNPWHDPDNGQFTFAGQGPQSGGGGDVTRSMRLRANGALAHRAQRKPNALKPKRQRPQSRPAAHIANDLIEKFKQHMIPNEGDRNDVYLDSRGIPTVGIGHRVTPMDGLKLGDRISEAQKERIWRVDDPPHDVAARTTFVRRKGRARHLTAGAGISPGPPLC